MGRLEGYINEDGFVTIQPNANHIPGEGNGFLNTGLAWACGMYDEVPIKTMIERCRFSDSKPLIWRSPWKRNPDDNQECDDYDGALPMRESWAKEVYEYAQDNDWDFSMHEEDEGDLNFRFDRFMHFPPFLAICSGESLPIWTQVIYSLSLLRRCFSIDEADPNKKSFCVLKKSRDKTIFGELIFSFWIYRVRQKYGTIGGSWAEAQPGHPINTYDGENLNLKN